MAEKYGVKEVMDLLVYDEDGRFVTRLDSLKNSTIVIEEDGRSYLFAKNALFNMDLLRFVRDSEEINLNDYDGFLSRIKNKKITFNNQVRFKRCKLIAISVIRNTETSMDKIIYYEIPRANAINKFLYSTSNEKAGAFDLEFDIEADIKGDLFYMHID